MVEPEIRHPNPETARQLLFRMPSSRQGAPFSILDAVHYDAPRTPHAEELMSASSDLFEASQTIALAHVLRP
jgi:hypothetical protein